MEIKYKEITNMVAKSISKDNMAEDTYKGIIISVSDIYDFCNDRNFKNNLLMLPQYTGVMDSNQKRIFINGENETLEECSAVYIIMQPCGEKIFYIGESSSCKSRLTRHYNNKKLWGGTISDDALTQYKVRILLVKDNIPTFEENEEIENDVEKEIIIYDNDYHLRLATEGYLYSYVKEKKYDYTTDNYSLFKFLLRRRRKPKKKYK